MSDHGPVRLLVVDDCPDDVLFLCHALSRRAADCEVTSAGDAPQALAALRQARHDVVLLDIRLPGRSGHDVLREIRADTALKGLVVVMFSSSADAMDVERAYAAGANAYLRKPTCLDGYHQLAAALDAFWFRLATLPRRA